MALNPSSILPLLRGGGNKEIKEALPLLVLRRG